MQYTIDTETSNDYTVVVKLDEPLSDYVLHAHACLQIKRELGTDKRIGIPFTSSLDTITVGADGKPAAMDDINPNNARKEFAKIGLPLSVLADKLGLPLDYIQHPYVPGAEGLPQDFDELYLQLFEHINNIVETAPTAALDPKPLAARLIESLHDNAQMPYEGIGKLCNVDADNIANADNLTDDEAYRICVALLIVDRELNYQRRT